MQIVERWILARLRDRTFFSLAEFNTAIGELLTQINAQRCAHCRSALTPSPPRRRPRCIWMIISKLSALTTRCRTSYSVPYKLIGKTVDVRVSAHTLEIFYRQQPVATHLRVTIRGHFTTTAEHCPERHSAVVDLTHERLQQRVLAIGPATAQVLVEQLHRRRDPEEALRASLGILRLARDFSPAQLEAAALRALALKVCSYRAVRALITTRERRGTTAINTLAQPRERARRNLLPMTMLLFVSHSSTTGEL